MFEMVRRSVAVARPGALFSNFFLPIFFFLPLFAVRVCDCEIVFDSHLSKVARRELTDFVCTSSGLTNNAFLSQCFSAFPCLTQVESRQAPAGGRYVRFVSSPAILHVLDSGVVCENGAIVDKRWFPEPVLDAIPRLSFDPVFSVAELDSIGGRLAHFFKLSDSQFGAGAPVDLFSENRITTSLVPGVGGRAGALLVSDLSHPVKSKLIEISRRLAKKLCSAKRGRGPFVVDARFGGVLVITGGGKNG